MSARRCAVNPSVRHVAPVLVLAALMAGCGGEPAYPSDWTPLSAATGAVGGHECPDLTGTYVLPRTVPTFGRKEKGSFVYLHRFLGVNPYQLDSGRVLSSTGPAPKMRLEGPSADGLRVTFFDRNDATLRVKTLQIGSDFECLGAWIGDAEPEHTRARPRHYYAQDMHGRLIGHKAYSGGGFTMLYRVIPLAAYVDDQEWWRIEPAR